MVNGPKRSTECCVNVISDADSSGHVKCRVAGKNRVKQLTCCSKTEPGFVSGREKLKLGAARLCPKHWRKMLIADCGLTLRSPPLPPETV